MQTNLSASISDQTQQPAAELLGAHVQPWLRRGRSASIRRQYDALE